MSRSREYTRLQRDRVIKRKKKICKNCKNIDWYKFDGQYSKGKIHCSCGMCRVRDHKGGHLLTRSELISIKKMSEELRLYEALLEKNAPPACNS